MPPPDPTAGRFRSEELVQRVVASRPGAERQRWLAALVRQTGNGAEAVRAFSQLQQAPDGKRLALEYAAAVPEPLPAPLVLLAAESLHDRGNPVPLRLTVAGGLLASVPDNPAAVGPIVRAVTVGLSRSKSLQRMLELQSRVEKCDTLDQMVQAANRSVKLKCPKCQGKYRRSVFVQHLWRAHRLHFDRGVAVEPRATIEPAVAAAAAAADPAAVDRAYALVAHLIPESTPAQILQSVAARQLSAGLQVPDELNRLAADARNGLCPNCLAPIPDPIPSPLPPLALSARQIAGAGYSVEVIDSARGRSVRVVTPKSESTEAPPGERRFSPRTLGVVTGLLVLLAGGVVLMLPYSSNFLLAVVFTILAWLAYAAVRFTRRPLPRGQRLVVDAAWRLIVPELKVNKANARWLARLCRTSIDRGTPIDRARTLNDLVADAAERFERGGPYVQLFAAARVLQVCDGAELGRDRVSGLVEVFEPFFRGELTAELAEVAAEIVTADDVVPTAEAARLGVRLVATAFEAGLTPVDLIRVLRVLPNLRVLCGTPALDPLRLMYVVWRWRSTEPWQAVGSAVPVFTLAESSPGACRRVLTAHPDAVLRLILPDAAERDLGEVVLTPRGIVVAGKVLSDPDADAQLIRSPRGSGWMLALGTQRIQLDRKLSPDVVALLIKWLRYRVTKLLPHAESQDRTSPAVLRRALGPLVRRCGLCGVECVCRSGRVGDVWPLT